jgi:AcrR family transcriptional regulator
MPRPARYDNDQIITATVGIAAEHGPNGTTIARIAAAVGAPTGSIYHRYTSRDVLLGEVWLRSVEQFQHDFAVHLQGPDAKVAGLAAARSVTRWVREHPDEARILLLHRSEDFFEDCWPAEMSDRAMRLRAEMTAALRDFCRRLLGKADRASMRIVSFALAEAPHAVLRKHVMAGERPPAIANDLIEVTYRAVLSLAGVRW